MNRIACIIPTYNGKEDLSRLLYSLDVQTIAFDTFIVDSTSNDGTLELARMHVEKVVIIPSEQFNHGGTRQLIVDNNPEYDFYIFLTQDAYLDDENAIRRVLDPFADSKVGAVSGRQLPHLDATALAQHARLFNYPNEVKVKTAADIPDLGIKTAFISNSFAAYRATALRAVGGFPEHVILAEDMYVGARMLMTGWKLAYAGNARCRHSHNYTAVEEFKRYFDIGVFHAREPWIRETFGGAGGEGLRYVISELKFLGLRRMCMWPNVMLRASVKLAGYKLGQQEANLPIGFKRMIGMHTRYWDGPFAAEFMDGRG